jgi:hypothetical protein
MPKKKKINNKETRGRYRSVIVDCAKLAKQYPKSERLRVYRECLKSKARLLSQGHDH